AYAVCRSRSLPFDYEMVSQTMTAAVLEPGREQCMSRVRVLVGTRKGAFVLTSDGKRESWDVNGPHFGGWEISHMKASPDDPSRVFASQSSSWFGQVIQRSRS